MTSTRASRPCSAARPRAPCSKCCCCCGAELQLVFRDGAPRRLRERDAAKQRAFEKGDGAPPRPRAAWAEVRGLRRCGNGACSRASTSFVDRDWNAAINILAAFDALDRGERVPPHMRRKPTDDVRARVEPQRFYLVPVVAEPAGARDGGWATHVRRTAAAAAAGVAHNNTHTHHALTGAGLPIVSGPPVRTGTTVGARR